MTGINLGDLTAGVRLDFDEASLQRELQAAQSRILAKPLKIALKPDVAALERELSGRAFQARTISIRLNMAGAGEINRELDSLKTRLGELRTNMQYRVTVDVTSLTVVNAQINTQITQLQSLIAQLRALGNAGGAGGGRGGSGAGAGLSGNTQQLLAQLQALNNEYQRGDVSADFYARRLGQLQTQLRTAAGAAQVGSAEFKALDRGLTQISQGLRNVDSAKITALRTELAGARAQFDAAAAAATNLAQRRAAIAAYEGDLNRIRAALAGMAASGNLTAQQMGNLQRMLAQVAREANTINGGVNLAGLSGNILNALNSVSGMGGALGMAAGQASGFASGIVGIASALGPMGVAAIAGATAIAGIGAAANKAVNEFAKLEYSMAMVSTLTDKTSAQLGTTKTALLEMSREIGVSTEELAKGLYDILGAGVDGTQEMAAAMSFLQQATKLATAGMTETSVATDVLTSVMNAYKLSAADTGSVSDKLFRTVDLGKISFEQLARSLGMVTAISSQAGVSLDETLAALATMTANGIQASSSVDYLRSLIKALVSPGEQARKIFEDLGVAYGDNALKSKGLVGVLQDLMQKTGGSTDLLSQMLGGVEAVTAATSIASGDFRRMNESIRGIGDAAGATETAYNKMADTLKKENDKLDANWSSLWKNLGAYFAPFKTDVISFMNDALDKLNKFIERTTVARNAANAVENIAEAEGPLNNARRELADLRARRAKEAATENPSKVILDRLDARIADTLAKIKPLEAKVAAIKAANAQALADQAAYNVQHSTATLAPGVQGPNMGGSGQAVDTSNLPVESGKFGYAFVSKLKDVFKNDPKVSSDCAVIAHAILSEMGIQLEKSPGARQLMQNAIKAGFQDVKPQSLKDLRSGDLITYEGPQYGALKFDKNGQKVGYHSAVYAGQNAQGQHTVIENPGSTNTRLRVLTEAELRQMIVLRSQQSAFDMGGNIKSPSISPTTATSTGTDKPAPNVTAALITKAQQLLDRVTAAQKAAQAKPNDPALKVAYSKATAELEAWTKANEANAAAMEAVRATQEKGARTTGQYIATQKDLQKYGNDALRLYKDLEKAQKSGSADAEQAAQRNIAAWMGESKAKKAVFDAESAAYKVRQSNTDRATADEQTRAKNRIQTQQNLQKALAEGREADARAALDNLKRSQAAELALAQNSAAKRAEIVKQTGPAIIAAEDRLANLRRDRAVKEARRAADEALKLPGADPKAIEATRVEAVRQAYRAAAADRARVRAEQVQAERGANQAALQAQQQHERERKRLMAQAAQEARNLQNAQADATLKRIQDNSKAELDAFKGTADEKLALIRRQSQAEFDAAELVARIRRDNALRENANKYAGKPSDPNKLAADALIRQTYTDTVTGLRNTRLGVVRAAQEAVTAEAERGAAELAQAQQAAYAETVQFIKDSIQGYSKEGLISLYNEARATRDQGLMAAVLSEFDRRAKQSAQEAADLWADLYDKAMQAGENPDDRSSPLDNRDAFKPSRQSLAALMGNPAAFAAAWRDLGMSDSLPELVLESFTADQFADLGVPVLEGLIASLSDSPQWAKVVEVIRAGLEQAADVAGMVFQRDNELGKPLGIVTGNEKPEPDPADRTDWERNQDAIRKSGIVESFTRMTDAELAAQAALHTLTEDTELYNAVLAEQKRRVDANKEALEGLPALLKQLELNDLNRRRDAGDVTDAAFIDERERLETELENAQWAVQQTKLTGQALENAEKEHQDRLKAIRANASKSRADGLAKDVADAKDYADRYIDALKQVQWAEDDLSGVQDRPYQAQIEGLEELADKWRAEEPELAERIDHLIGKLRQLQKQAEMVDGLKSIGDGLGGIFNALGMADFGKISTNLGGLAKAGLDIKKGFDGIGPAFQKSFGAGLGAVGGFLGAVGVGIDLVVNIGNAIENLSPGIQAWKKGLLEVAEAEKKVAAESVGMFKNPYSKALGQDAANREKLASSNWLQRLGWGLFGGAPQVMSDEAAKLQVSAAEIFGEMAQTISSTLESSLMNAFETGIWEDIELGFEKSLNSLMAKMALKAIVASSGLETKLKAYTDARAKALTDNLITPGEQANLDELMGGVRAAASGITDTWRSVAPTLPGYGQGGADASGNPAQGNLFGNAPTVQLGIPRLEVTLPESVTAAFTAFNAAVPEFRSGVSEWRQATAEFRALMSRGGSSGPPPLSGLGGLT